MTHFLDTLVGHKHIMHPLFVDVLSELGRAECILADNAFRYFFEHSGLCNLSTRTHEYVGTKYVYEDVLEALHSIIPPFAVTFVTCRDFIMDKRVRAGILLIRKRVLDSQPELFSHYLGLEDRWQSRFHLRDQGVRWIVYAIPMQEVDGEILPPFTAGFLLLQENGRLFLFPKQRMVDYVYSGYDYLGGPEHLRDVMLGMLMPTLFTLSLIHSRPVQVVEHDPTPTRALRRQSERRKEKTGVGLIRFHTLQIDEIKRVLEEEGRIREVGLAQALHLVRGHWKDYTKGKGLFGRIHRPIWVNEHHRGDLENGAILKDYKAPPPEPVTMAN